MRPRALAKIGVVFQQSTLDLELTVHANLRFHADLHGLARALLHRPEILLMDEPTVGLDPASQALLPRHVLELRLEHRVGVLWATHLVDEAERADPVAGLHQGRVEFDGMPAAFRAGRGVADLAEAFFRLSADRAVIMDASG